MTAHNGLKTRLDASVANTTNARGTRGRADGAYDRFLATLDPRGTSQRSQALVLALAASPDVRFNEFVARLDDPRFARHSLAAIARTCDISFAGFVEICRKAAVGQAWSRAIRALPELVEDMAADDFAVAVLSKSDPAALATCGGSVTRRCPQCDGAGKVRAPGNAGARKLILEIAGRIGIPAVEVTQNFCGMGLDPFHARMKHITLDIVAEISEPATAGE